ncbi:MAG: DUF2268 domain-containing protein [Ardenticatenaceae bacterium]
MKTEWISTNNFYHQLVAEPDMERRKQLYRDLFIEPWKPMMDMMGPMFGGDSSDEFAVARAWGWLLPEELSETPDALRKLEAADAWRMGAEALAKGAARFEPYADRIAFDSVTGWLVIADPARSNPIGRGYTGSIDWTQPRLMAQYDTPNDYNLPRLSGAVVHELHHLIRLKIFPWDMANTNVADYIILEGMAESFAASLFGEEIIGYYVTDFNDKQLQTAQKLIHDGLNKTGFNVIRGYIFGDSLADKFHFQKIGMPDYGGYAIGYRVVQAYLKRSGKSIEEATFLPADEIIRESGFFE